jgi:hypothetical protein
MERRQRELEAEAGHQQDEGDGEQRTGGVVRREPRAIAGDVRRLRGAVEERGAVEDEAGGERAHEEVLEAGLVRDRHAAVEADQDEDADREDLQAEDDEQEVEALGHHHHADRAPHQQRVERAVLDAFALEVLAREERGHHAGQEERDVEDTRDGADLVRAAEERAAVRRRVLRPRRGHEDRSAPAARARLRARREGVEEDEQHAARIRNSPTKPFMPGRPIDDSVMIRNAATSRGITP